MLLVYEQKALRICAECLYSKRELFLLQIFLDPPETLLICHYSLWGLRLPGLLRPLAFCIKVHLLEFTHALEPISVQYLFTG